MSYLYILTGAAFILSLVFDRRKTFRALTLGFKRLLNILPAMLMMVVLTSFLPVEMADTALLRYLENDSQSLSVLLAASLGTVTMLPGFIVFPLCGILLQKGIPYMVLSAFTTTAMMVGIVTYPVEKNYLGRKITILRNLLSFGIALVVALVTGIVFGEVW